MNPWELVWAWAYAADGHDYRIDSFQLPSGKWVPHFLGLAPLKAPEDVERWMISVLYYDANENVTLIRKFTTQHKWSERAALV